MIILEDTWNVILAGKWNKYILSPEWASRNIFHSDNVMVEFAVPMDLPPRYSADKIRLLPSSNRVFIAVQEFDDEHLAKIENMAIEMSNLLRYTPIHAVGINFGFQEEISALSVDLFTLPDYQDLLDFGFAVDNPFVKRRLILGDSTLFLTIEGVDGKVNFDFNFHYPIALASEVETTIKGKTIANKNLALRVLRDVYKLELA
jgi:hypothetical protein